MKTQTKPRHGIVLIITALFWFSLYIYIPYQTPYLTAIGVGSAFIGTIVGCYGATQMVVRVPLGIYAGIKTHHKPFITAGTFLAAASSVLRFVWPSGTSFLIANLFSGIAASTWISFTVLYSNYFSPDQIKKATGNILAANNAGTLIGFITGTVVTQFADVPLLFPIAIGAGSIAFILSFFVDETMFEEPSNVERISVRSLLKGAMRRRLWVFAIAALLIQGVNMSTAMSFTTQYASEIGGTKLQVGICSICYMVTLLLMTLFAGSNTARKIGDKKLFPIFLACYALYCVFVPFAKSMWVLYVLQLLGGAAYAVPFSLCMSCAMTGVPIECKSTAMGIYQAVYGVGMTFVPMLMGLLVGAFGMPIAYYSMGILCVASAVLTIFALSKKGFLEQ